MGNSTGQYDLAQAKNFSVWFGLACVSDKTAMDYCF